MAHRRKDQSARVADLVNRAEGMAALIQRAKQLNVLNRWLQNRLPEAVRQHVRVVNLAGDTLVLAADNPAWASRLRCLVPELLQPLNNEHGTTGLHRIRVRVAIPQHSIEPRRPPRPAISEGSAAYLKNVANHTDDPDLKSVLLRLSSRG